MTAYINSKKNFAKKLRELIANTRDRGENLLVIYSNEGLYKLMFQMFKNNKEITVLRSNNSPIFVYEEIRIDLKKIEYYV